MTLAELLVCPLCHGDLDFVGETIECTRCSGRFPQGSGRHPDLVPPDWRREDATRWSVRQESMEDWYETTDRGTLAEILHADFAEHAQLLAELSGRVLDVGGGSGAVRHYLPSTVWYVSLDPSETAVSPMWSELASDFPCLQSPPRFVRGVGEHLPFRSESFDAVLLLYSLNHAAQPERVVSEAKRVLRPDARIIVVLEDAAPRWRDLVASPLWRLPRRRMPGKLWRMMLDQAGLRDWPVQEDHVSVGVRDLVGWLSSDLEILHRDWAGHPEPAPYFVLDARKRR